MNILFLSFKNIVQLIIKSSPLCHQYDNALTIFFRFFSNIDSDPVWYVQYQPLAHFIKVFRAPK